MAQNIVSVGIRLRQLQVRSGLSMQQLAVEMKYKSASSIQRYLSPEYGETHPLPIAIATKFSNALARKGSPPIEIDEVFALSGVEVTSGGSLRATDLEGIMALGVAFPTMAMRQSSLMEEATTKRLPKDLPVYGSALGAELAVEPESGDITAIELACLDMSEAIDHVRRPDSLAGRRDCYALVIAGSSMAPRFEDGEIVIVDPKRPILSGNDVIVQLKNGSGHDGEDRVITVLAKRLVRRSASFVELEQFNPPGRFRLETRQIHAMHRIMTIGELVGA
jgi:hypothetical protein